MNQVGYVLLGRPLFEAIGPIENGRLNDPVGWAEIDRVLWSWLKHGKSSRLDFGTDRGHPYPVHDPHLTGHEGRRRPVLLHLKKEADGLVPGLVALGRAPLGVELLANDSGTPACHWCVSFRFCSIHVRSCSSVIGEAISKKCNEINAGDVL
jgi:hypothetical protein